MSLTIRHIELIEANRYVIETHRHHGKCVAHRFSIGCYDGDRLCGVAIVGNPIARGLCDGNTLEVLRCCTDGTHNACSMLYGRCARIARELGYQKIITYILQSESGVSLKASGWELDAENVGGARRDGMSHRGEGKSQNIRYGARLRNILLNLKIDIVKSYSD